MFERLQKIIEQQLSVDVEEISLDALIIDDLGADSLDLVELVMAVEEEFDVEIDDNDVEQIKTVQDIISYIENHIEK